MSSLLALLSLLPGFEKELRLLPMFLRPGRVCIDIGASLGVYSIPMAMIVGASGAVLAFEPRSDAATKLRRRASALRLSALRVEAAALGVVATTSTLVVPRRRRLVAGRSFVASGTVCDGLDDSLVPGLSLQVPVTTLDAVRASLGRPVDFVKCDVEGAEHDVFSGGRSVLEHDRPTVLCEIEERHTRRYGRSVDDVFAVFAEHGYRPVARAAGDDIESRNIVLLPEERQLALP